MTDAHCHIRRGASRHFICDPTEETALAPGDIRFIGTHPWYCENFRFHPYCKQLEEHPDYGIGEAGLDRLKGNAHPIDQEIVLLAHVAIAANFKRPIVLHGVKCWGRVVKQCKKFKGRIPALLFHGFSRAEGLLPDIFAMNGFISVGPALLNDHAVNYRAMVQRLPQDRILVESDATAETAAETPTVEEIAAKLAELRGEDPAELNAALEANADRFVESLR